MGRTVIVCARLFVATLVVTGLQTHSFSTEQKTGAAAKPPKILLRAPLNLAQPPFAGGVEAIAADGALRIGPFKSKSQSPPPAPENGPLTAGYYLGVVRGTYKDLRDASLLRVQVTKVSKDGIVEARVARGLDDKIPVDELILLVRPPQATTAQMKALPDLITIEEGPAPVPPADEPSPDTDLLRIERAVKNLATIGKALYTFEDSYGQFPPAALVGPDGKPWHSWRVILLPFLADADHSELYFSYRFDEPWDGPHNKQLLERMPRVYTDQPPERPTDTFTRYAAVTGQGAMFSADGFRFDGKKMMMGKGAGIKQKQISDGASNTLAVGTLPVDVKIPWTKPEDIVIGEKPARIGEKGGFGAPYKSSKGHYALFLRADGAVEGVFDSVQKDDLHSMFLIGDKKPLDIQKVPGVFFSEIAPPAKKTAPRAAKGSTNQALVIYIFEEDGQTKARLAR